MLSWNKCKLKSKGYKVPVVDSLEDFCKWNKLSFPGFFLWSQISAFTMVLDQSRHYSTSSRKSKNQYFCLFSAAFNYCSDQQLNCWHMVWSTIQSHTWFQGLLFELSIMPPLCCFIRLSPGCFLLQTFCHVPRVHVAEGQSNAWGDSYSATSAAEISFFPKTNVILFSQY